MLLGVEKYAGQLKVSMGDSSPMAVAEQGQELPNDGGCSVFLEIFLRLKGSGERFSMLVLDDYEEAVVIFEEFVYFGDSRVVNLLELPYLLLE